MTRKIKRAIEIADLCRQIIGKCNSIIQLEEKQSDLDNELKHYKNECNRLRLEVQSLKFEGIKHNPDVISGKALEDKYYNYKFDGEVKINTQHSMVRLKNDATISYFALVRTEVNYDGD